MAKPHERSDSPAQHSPPSVAKQKKLKQKQQSAKAAKQVEAKFRQLELSTSVDSSLRASSTIACNKLIAAEARQGHLEQVEQVLQDMRCHCLQPDIYTYNGLIHAAVKANNARAAKKWLQELQEHPSVQPDVTSFNTILSLYCKSNRIADALELFEDIKRRQLADRVTYNTLFGLLLRDTQHCQTGIDIFKAIDPTTTQLDGTTIAYVMKFYLRLEQPANSLMLFSNLPTYRLELCSQTTNAAMLTYLEVNEVQDARNVFVQLARQTRPDEATCTSLVTSFGDKLEAFADWLHERRSEGIVFTPCMLGYMLKAVIAKHGSLLAEQFMARLTGGSKVVKMAQFDLDAIVFGILIQAIASEGDASTTAVAEDHSQQRGPRCRFWLRKMVAMGISIPLAPLTSFMNALGNDGDANVLMTEFRAWQPLVEFDELMYKTAVSWLSKMGEVGYVNEVLAAMPMHISASRCVGTARQQLPPALLPQLKTRRQSPHASPTTRRRSEAQGRQQQPSRQQRHHHGRSAHQTMPSQQHHAQQSRPVHDYAWTPAYQRHSPRLATPPGLQPSATPFKADRHSPPGSVSRSDSATNWRRQRAPSPAHPRS
eukprot:m.155809 g.155809  ORF g.155809 m.155809 type:complete len:597 (+) comp16425_c0_seq7:3961-5751(+)